MQNDGLVVVGQGKSDEIPSLILNLGFALKIYLNDATHNEIYKSDKQLWMLILRVIF